MTFKKLFVFIGIAIISIGSFATPAFAAGNIDSVQKYSQFLNIDLDNNAKNDFVNWSPSNGGATVSDTKLTGTIWGETVGWINLAPNTAGVTNTCSGLLGGYAWGQNTGWINFAPTNALGPNKPQINTTTGQITGTVWTQNYGWLQLSSPDGTNPGLVTSWHGCTGGTGPTGGSTPPGNNNGGCAAPLQIFNGICQSPVAPAVNPPVNPPVPPVVNPITPTVPQNNPSPGQVIPNNSPTPGGPGNPPVNQNQPHTPPALQIISGISTGPGIGFAVENFAAGIFGGRSTSYWWLLPIVAGLGLISTVPGLVTRFVNLFLAFIFGRKRARGIVYDSENKEPLDPAYISVIDTTTGQEVMSQITDIHGRYGFILKPGTYKLTAGKTHYVFPSQKLVGKINDEVYGDLYFGQPFTVTNPNQVITMNIPMDRVGTDWNQVEKERTNIVHSFLKIPSWFATFLDSLFAVGFIISIGTTYYYPVWWNVLITVLYVLISILRIIGYGPVHAGIIKVQGAPLPFAIVRAFSATLGREVAHTVTSSAGGYYMLVTKGDYYLSIETKNPDGTYTVIGKTAVMRAHAGVISRSLEL